ncbi:MAG: hypothetical protein BroJett018_36190 [Chloroflexota bacterium]|nr:MAG: hypothetical protein BroJett018_36190 [Chloroflexota bacterium]
MQLENLTNISLFYYEDAIILGNRIQVSIHRIHLEWEHLCYNNFLKQSTLSLISFYRHGTVAKQHGLKR